MLSARYEARLLWHSRLKDTGSRNPLSNSRIHFSFSFFSFFWQRTSWHGTSNTTNSEYPLLHLCEMEFYTFPVKPCFWFEVLTPEVGWHVLSTRSLLSGTHRQQPGPALPLLTCFLRAAQRCFHMPLGDSEWISPLCVLRDCWCCELQRQERTLRLGKTDSCISKRGDLSPFAQW